MSRDLPEPEWIPRPTASQPSSSSEITEAIDAIIEKAPLAFVNGAGGFGDAELAAARSRLESLYREQLQEIERLRAFEGPDYQYAGNHIPRAAIECRNEEIRELYARLSSLKDSQLTRIEALEMFREEQARDKAEIDRLRNLVSPEQRIVT